jgi:beta-glucosidase/6-phospho-beta-glucosidase/beta-galactosidase
MSISLTRPFMFATGIENSYPTVALPDGTITRVDEMRRCGHYARWREDFELVRELGIDYLRYGPPYYRTHIGPGRYDWTFADETFNELRVLGLTPIVDLCHFGVPDWIGNFQNPEWPRFFEEYARAFAERYGWCQLYTPVNEIFVCATFSAQYGWWNERLSSERAFVTALQHLCQANTRAMRAILAVQPAAVFIQSESSEYFHADEPCCIPLAQLRNEKRFLSLDLTYGHPISAEMYQYLTSNGFSDADYTWFRENQVAAHCIMGTDYYESNEHYVHRDGRWWSSGEVFGYYVIARQYFDRYRLPMMHMETNIAEPHSTAWLKKEWANVVRLKQDGIPVLGFTWYSLTDQVDWDSALRECAGRVNPLGLYNLDRRIRPVGQAFRQLLTLWRDIVTSDARLLSLGY